MPPTLRTLPIGFNCLRFTSPSCLRASSVPGAVFFWRPGWSFFTLTKWALEKTCKNPWYPNTIPFDCTQTFLKVYILPPFESLLCSFLSPLPICQIHIGTFFATSMYPNKFPLPHWPICGNPNRMITGLGPPDGRVGRSLNRSRESTTFLQRPS